MYFLITGATGALGRTLMPRLLRIYPDAQFMILTRRTVVDFAHPRVHLLCCDLREAGWTSAIPPSVAARVTAIVHMAADVRWNAALDLAVEINAAASARLADWAIERCPRLRVFCYVSTAYVEAPSHLEGAPGYLAFGDHLFNNSYEYSKYLGEQEILQRRLPTVVVRPSLIIGDSASGAIHSFNGLYTLLRFASQGLVPIVAGDPVGYVDLVAIDTVVDAIGWALGVPPAASKRIVWAIGGDRTPRVQDLLAVCLARLNTFRSSRGVEALPLPKIVAYETYQRLYRPWIGQQALASQKRMMDYIDVFTPYFSVKKAFKADARDMVFRSPDWETVLPLVVDYWCHANSALAVRRPKQWQRATTSVM